MTGLGAFLGRLVAVLDASEVPYLITGSVAAAYHGPPRTTQDVDVVIDLAKGQLKRLEKSLDPNVFYFDEETLREAVARRGQFNLVDLESGWKADLILKKARPFSHQEFQHRIRVRVFDLELWIARAEDTVISKLEWAKMTGGSERQLQDVRGILDTKGAELDLEYVEKWVAELKLADMWERARGP